MLRIKGFILVELLVVIAILATLTALLIPAIASVSAKPKEPELTRIVSKWEVPERIKHETHFVPVGEISVPVTSTRVLPKEYWLEFGTGDQIKTEPQKYYQVGIGDEVVIEVSVDGFGGRWIRGWKLKRNITLEQ